jgi:long-chain acyl-CoA synthetase
MADRRNTRNGAAGTAGALDGVRTLQDLLRHMEGYDRETALTIFDTESRSDVSFAELVGRARKVAHGLVARGLAQGTPVALFGTNSLDWVVCRFALILADALCVPIDFDADPKRLNDLLADSGAQHLFVSADKLPTARKALETLDRDIEIFVLAPPDQTDDELPPGLDSLQGEQAGDLPEADPEAPVAQFYTSGTTGAPKAVPLTHTNILLNVEVLYELDLVGAGDRVLLPLPLHHSYPFIVGLMLPLWTGASVVFPAGVSGPQLIRALQEAEVDTIVGVPRLYEALADGIERRVTSRGLLVGKAMGGLISLSGSVRRRLGVRIGRWLLWPLHKQLGPKLGLLVSGGARLDEGVAWRLEGLGYQVLSGYGLVETTSVATFNPPGKAKLGSAGRKSRVVEMRLQPVEELEQDEIQFRGPIVFSGYANNPEANESAFTEDGWFRTGDLGSLDDDGYLFIRGRVKEMIVMPGGKNVAPEEVEKVYVQSPHIKELAVLERNDKLVGLIVPEVTSEPGKMQQMIRVSLGELGPKLPGYMRLADFALTREALPRNQLGKYKRHQLPEIYDRAERGETGERRELSEEEKERLSTPRAREVVELLQAQAPDRRIHPDTSLQMELGIDSLSWVELSLDLERRLGVSLSDETTSEVSTVGELIDAVEQADEAGEDREVRREKLLAQRDRWLADRGPLEMLANRILYGLAWVLAKTVFRLSVEGRSKVPAEGPMLVIANHLSDLDPGAVAVALPTRTFRRTWWAGDNLRLFSNPLKRAFSRTMHIFPVDARAPGATLEMGSEVLRRGAILAWFPEEWRSPDGSLQPFRPGIGRLIDEHRPPVVPCIVTGTFEAMPRTARVPKPHPLHVRFGEPFPSEELLPSEDTTDEAERHRAIAKKLHDRLAELAGDDLQPKA